MKLSDIRHNLLRRNYYSELLLVSVFLIDWLNTSVNQIFGNLFAKTGNHSGFMCSYVVDFRTRETVAGSIASARLSRKSIGT